MPDLIYWTVSRDNQTPCVDFSVPFENYLTPYELERLGHLRFPKRRAEWLHGRWTVKYLLRHSDQAFANLTPTIVQVKNEPEGLPFLERFSNTERIPANISLSHRDHRAFCALTSTLDLKIGVDMELVEARPPSFLEDFFTPREFQQGNGYGDELRDLWFTLIWSLKESMLKALGTGLRLDTRCVEILCVEGLPLRKAATELEWHGARVRFESYGHTHWRVWWRVQDHTVYTIAALLTSSAKPPELCEVSPCLEGATPY